MSTHDAPAEPHHERRKEEAREEEGRVLSIHVGHSANCSSVGSFVDFLFVSSVVGAAAIGAFTILVRRASSSSTGPESAGPERAGPESAGPERAGPERAGPESETASKDRDREGDD